MKKIFATYEYLKVVKRTGGKGSTLFDYDDSKVSNSLLDDLKSIARKGYRLESFDSVIITSIVILGDAKEEEWCSYE